MTLLDDLIGFGQELREMIRRWGARLAGEPPLSDERAKAVLMWATSLTFASWDVSDSVFDLARANGNNIRGMKILCRSLFEYAVKLHYFAYKAEEVEKSAENVLSMLRKVTRANRHFFDRTEMTDEEVANLDSLLNDGDDKVDRENFREMLKYVVHNHLGLEPEKACEAEKWFYENYYAISSGISHGSQALILDMYRSSESGGVVVMAKTDRIHTIEVVAEAIHNLLWTLRAISSHVRSDEYNMIKRHFDLKYENQIKAEVERLDKIRDEERSATAHGKGSPDQGS